MLEFNSEHKSINGSVKAKKGAQIRNFIIAGMLIGSIFLFSGCQTKEEKQISNGRITIDNSEYQIGSLYYLINKENSEISYICTMEKIGSYLSHTELTENVYSYNDIKTGRPIAITENRNIYIDFSEICSKEDLQNLAKAYKFYDIYNLYELIDYENAQEKGFILSEADIFDSFANPQKRY